MENNEYREDNGIIYLSVTSYGLSGQEWIDLFNRIPIEISDSFKYSLNPEAFDYSINCSQKFKVTKGVIYEIAILKPDLLFPNWRDRTTLNIRRKACQILPTGSDVVKNAEVFCLLSEEFSAKDSKRLGIKKIFGLTKSRREINDGLGDFPAQLFIMDLYRRKKCLDQDNDSLNLHTYRKGDGFAFIISETELSSLESET